jgi:N-acetylmuramoyl-L-alanine amidase
VRALAIGGMTVTVLVLTGPAGATRAAATLTLNAPGATGYGHVIDFAGRLAPARPGVRVRLYRGTSHIASARLRPDGTYRLRVSVGRPGPFHTEAGAISSRPVTVRIVPLLKTKLVGTRVAGEPLTMLARVQPRVAGAVRVRVIRNRRETYRGSFARQARIELGTTTLAPFRIAVDVLPTRGYETVVRELDVALRAPTIAYGYRGPYVAELLRRLGALGYATPSQRVVLDGDAQQSVYAFQKAQGLERTGVADPALWRRLAHPEEVIPRDTLPASHIEVDKRRQILMLVRDGHVTFVSPVSTAGIPGYFTPVGRFAIQRKVPGYDPSPLGVLYKPMYFHAGYAIHGNPSVPPYPASHGCIRVPNFVIERLYATEPFGEVVIVY